MINGRTIGDWIAAALVIGMLFSACGDSIVKTVSDSCGNGLVDAGETCDSGIAVGQTGACPADCDDENLCTTDTPAGSREKCDTVCAREPITACVNDDGCCPADCTEENDNNCALFAICGNGVVEIGETCDVGIAAGATGACPSNCDDNNYCTADGLLDAGGCTSTCAYTPVAICINGDGCCPEGCNASNDGDCQAVCGNGVAEPGETCDGDCPASCYDGAGCTSDRMTGSADDCDAACGHTAITQCFDGDGCCPPGAGCDNNTDNDCLIICGNGALETGETCDTLIPAGSAGACPGACNDGDPCTTDMMHNAGTCAAVCVYVPITDCINNDGCCLITCSFLNDSDCGNPCGDRVVGSGETCDVGITAGQPGACPTGCDDGDNCTIGVLHNAGTCTASCTQTTISSCIGNDGCCPGGCNANNDSDCEPLCGNGVVESGETCDGDCPTTVTDCNDGNACTTDTLQNGGTCAATCINTVKTSCVNNDYCCPNGCTAGTDNDCNTVCGDGFKTGGETCDTAIAAGQSGACPTTCNDGNACTTDALHHGGTCQALCVVAAITTCKNGDGCCPSGATCNHNTDSDCPVVCGNGAVETGEICDTKIAAGQTGACPTACNDGNGCTTDTLLNPGTCRAACSYTAITTCKNNDSCCPAGCNANNDNSCVPLCGNGVVESGELCDTAIGVGQSGACPIACNDGIACTTDTLQNAGTCTATCVNTAITTCVNGDDCCPTGCNHNNDRNCPSVCGNGVLEEGEACDITIPAGRTGACPTSCDDGNVCTADKLYNGGTCIASCDHAMITTCKNDDSCCPSGCNANNDSNCTPVCGNSVIESGETCDPPSSCPASCSDGNVCTKDTMTGSAARCTVACAHQSITSCTNGDGCCPAGCTTSADTDCINLNSTTWIWRVITKGTIETPIGNDTAATIDIVQRIYITKSGSTITMRYDICDLDTTGTINDASFSIDFSNVLRLFTKTVTKTDFPVYVSGPVSFPDFVILAGWNSSGNAVNSDSDSHPGITLPTDANGADIDIYAGVTLTSKLSSMILSSATTMSGSEYFSAYGYIFDAYWNGYDLDVNGPLTVTPSSTAIPVTLIKLTGNASCATVLNHCTGTTCVP